MTDEKPIEKLNPEKIKEEDLVDLIEEPAWKTILLNLVNSEKYDPWNIDLCDLADKYLQKINSLTQNDLRIPANAILACAILLKTKSKFLKISSIEDEEEKAKQMEKLFEEFIPELRSPRRIREGKVSLDELVNAIEQIIEKTKRKRFRLLERQSIEFQIPFSQENIEEKINKIFEKIKEKADSQGMVTFSALLKEKSPSEMVNVFIPLLFLANKGKIALFQEEFFGEIFITILNNENAS
jgi:segregation and condensation protein A